MYWQNSAYFKSYFFIFILLYEIVKSNINPCNSNSTINKKKDNQEAIKQFMGTKLANHFFTIALFVFYSAYYSLLEKILFVIVNLF